MKKMKALRYFGIQDVRCKEIEIPGITDDTVLVKVLYAGICGSDLHIYNKGMFIEKIPETMGHEYVGKIEKIGKNVNGFSTGDYVTSNPMIPCGECSSCELGNYNTCENLSFIGERSQGCFAEYISVKQKDLVKISKTKEIKSLALAEPFAVALNICNRAHFKTDDKLAIIGAGPIGLLVIKAAKEIYGVENITAIDLSDERLKIALQMGARTTSKKLSGKEKFNKIVECAGVEQTFKNALENVEANGNVYVVSIFEKDFEFDINKLVSKQISIIGCNVYTKKNLIDSVNLISNKKVYIDKLVSKVFNLEDVNKAFDLLNSENKSVAKVLFKIK